MKHFNLLFLVICIILHISCNPVDGTDPLDCDTASINLVAPVNGEPCTSGAQVGERFFASFVWGFQGEELSNAILTVRDVTSNTIVSNSEVVSSPAELLLEYDRDYTWQVSAQSCGGQLISQQWEFTTTGSPRTDNAPRPAEIAVVDRANSTARINWIGSDQEGGVLSYTVFVDQNEDPIAQVGSVSGESGKAQSIVIGPAVIQNAGEIYYVKVETTDQRGNKSISITSFLAL